jgi:amidase
MAARKMNERSLDEIRAALASGEANSASLTAAYLERIQKLRALNCMREVNSEALRIAAHCDRERREGRVRSPLHGVRSSASA